MPENEKGFGGAARLLPPELREAALALPGSVRASAEELRLRAGAPPSVSSGGGETFFPTCRTVTKRDLDSVLDMATRASAYAARDSLRSGYVTARGGYRIGAAGTAAMSGGAVAGFAALSSLAIRIPREVTGIAEPLLQEISPEGGVRSTLIISPPGAGKTTLLRDMVRAVSDGGRHGAGLRVSLADERGEVAALADGEPQMDVGRRTDVLEGCPKAAAVMMLLRTMNPQVVALDEITAPEDVAAVESAANCGVKLLATAHAEDMDDLRRRRMYMRLLDGAVFEYAVFIVRGPSGRSYTVRKLR